MNAAGPARIGLIGCGRAAGATSGDASPVWSHPRAIAAHPGLHLEGAFDTDSKQLAAFCQAANVRPCGSVDELLAADLDCLLVASPTNTHAALLRRGIERGIKTLVCEKPLTDEARGARAIADECRANGNNLFVYYPRRWITRIGETARDVAAGRFGAVQTFHAWYGGGFLNIGCHAIDLLRELGLAIVRVAAHPGPMDDESPLVRVELAGGMHGLFQPSDYSAYPLFELDLLLARGRVRLSDLGFRLETWRRAPSTRYEGYHDLAQATVEETDYGLAAKAFWNAVYQAGRGEAVVVDDHDSYILSVVEAVQAALTSGKPIEIRTGD